MASKLSSGNTVEDVLAYEDRAVAVYQRLSLQW